jgi:hypothetical protein
MKNIEGAFGNIGHAKKWVNGMLFKTTKKEGFQIHGFDDQAKLQLVASQRDHAVKEVAQATNGEWVYTH